MAHGYSYKEHTADITLQVYADTYVDLLRCSLQGMFAIMKPKYLQGVTTVQERSYTVEGNDDEIRLVGFLSQALCLGSIYHEAYGDAHILYEASSRQLTVLLYGRPVDRYGGVEIKAVTFYNLRVVYSATGVEAMITFDI